MGFFDHFINKASKSKHKQEKLESIQLDRDAILNDIGNAMLDCGAQNRTAYSDIERALRKARRAVANNNPALKDIACNELRMALALYRYTAAMRTNLQMMESNVNLHGVTANFANMVNRVTAIKIPAETTNFKALTQKALKGLQPVDLVGIEEMTKRLIEASISATSTATIEDRTLEDLINNRVSLDNYLNNDTITQAGYTEPAASVDETNYAVSEIPSSDEVMKMIESLNFTLNKGN